jgi:serine/threonine protein kinase
MLTMIDVGQTVGNYNVTAKLGEGGMGVVFLAEHPVIGRKAALKVVHPRFGSNPEMVARFVTEAKLVNQIGHEHIVDVTDFGETAEGDTYFIMEYLDGESLAERIERDGLFSPERALFIAAQVADALRASHEHDVVHRDVKPDNIYLVTRGEDKDFVKVLDFGLAKLLHSDEVPSFKSRTGSVMGTPYYMAPEQCEGKPSIDQRADIYSLGVILFEMLTGKIPFGGDSYGEIMVKQVTMRPPAARSLVPDLPASLDLILFRALAKDPAQRFQTMGELRDALLDPEAYAASAPAEAVLDDLSGRARTAMPMARSAIRPLETVGLGPNTSGEAILSGSGAGFFADDPTPTRASRPNSSTFREGVGQIDSDGDTKLASYRGRVVRLTTAVAVVAITLVVVTHRREAGRLLAGAPGVNPSSQSTMVRVNFGSDPDGAAILSSDGQTLGVTPLSIVVPYSDKGREYTFRKDGFLSKTVSIVPNLSSPLFAVLESVPLVDPPAAPAVVAPPTEPPVAATMQVASTSSARSATRDHEHHRRAKSSSDAPILPADIAPVDDGDGVLEPSFQ